MNNLNELKDLANDYLREIEPAKKFGILLKAEKLLWMCQKGYLT